MCVWRRVFVITRHHLHPSFRSNSRWALSSQTLKEQGFKQNWIGAKGPANFPHFNFYGESGLHRGLLLTDIRRSCVFSGRSVWPRNCWTAALLGTPKTCVSRIALLPLWWACWPWRSLPQHGAMESLGAGFHLLRQPWKATYCVRPFFFSTAEVPDCWTVWQGNLQAVDETSWSFLSRWLRHCEGAGQVQACSRLNLLFGDT